MSEYKEGEYNQAVLATCDSWGEYQRKMGIPEKPVLAAQTQVSAKWNIPFGSAIVSGIVVSLLGGFDAGVAVFGLVVLSYIFWPRS